VPVANHTLKLSVPDEILIVKITPASLNSHQHTPLTRHS